MKRTLDKLTRGALQESQDRFRAIFEQASVGVAEIVSQTGRFVRINRRYCEIVGYTREEMLQKTFQEITHPEDLQADLDNMHEMLAGRTRGFRMEKRYHRKDGSVVWVDLSVSPLWEPGEAPTHHVAVAADITDRKLAEGALRQAHDELERRVRERTAELSAVNSELESFSYAVAHDLRAPLRNMEGFSQALLEDCDDGLDERGRHYLQRIQAAAEHMGHLISDILDLSRITQAQMVREPLDLGRLAEEAATALRKEQPRRRVEFRVAGGLRVTGDRRLLGIMLRNLLDNAWKFTGPRGDAVVELGVNGAPGQRAFFVRDNGVGFDMAYVDKLFVPFQRLHGTAEFPGTGIGLATVRRIVHRHGGRVWAEGRVETGATFCFTLPEAAQDTRGAPDRPDEQGAAP